MTLSVNQRSKRAVVQVLGKAVEQGAEVVSAPYPEGSLTIATVRDPAGNVIGVWQEAAR